jgi:hypothetical protein
MSRSLKYFYLYLAADDSRQITGNRLRRHVACPWSTPGKPVHRPGIPDLTRFWSPAGPTADSCCSPGWQFYCCTLLWPLTELLLLAGLGTTACECGVDVRPRVKSLASVKARSRKPYRHTKQLFDVHASRGLSKFQQAGASLGALSIL